MAYKPKVVTLDIENSPMLAHVWDMYETNVLKVERHSYILSVAYQFYPSQKIHVKAIWHYKGYSPEAHDDYALVKDIWELLDSADIVIGQNSDAFDLKKLYTRFLFHGLGIPKPCASIDVLKINRSIFKHPSNKLDEVCQYHGIGRKLPHTGKELWFGCMAGNKVDQRMMEKYNAHDVYLTRAVYDKVASWAKPSQHPNMALMTGVYSGCVRCSSKRFNRRGPWRNRGGKTQYERLQCLDCGKWNKGPNEMITKENSLMRAL